MAKDDMGTAGGVGPVFTADPIQGPTPTTGFDDAPGGEIKFGMAPAGVGCSRKGAH